MDNRIQGDRVPLDRGAVRDFFRGRAGRVSAERPFAAVLYQDCNPELARRRDAAEKARGH